MLLTVLRAVAPAYVALAFAVAVGGEASTSGTVAAVAAVALAAVLAAAGAAAFYHGRSVAETELLPTRSVRQITQDIKTAKEQLT